MQNIAITTYENYFKLDHDGHVYVYPVNRLRIESMNTDTYIYVFYDGQRIISANYGTDNIDIDGTTSFANKNALITAFADAFFKMMRVESLSVDIL